MVGGLAFGTGTWPGIQAVGSRRTPTEFPPARFWPACLMEAIGHGASTRIRKRDLEAVWGLAQTTVVDSLSD